MPEGTDTNTSTQDGNDTTDTTSSGGDAFTPITSQEDLNRIISDRIGRERSKFADYDDIKAKAESVDAIEAAKESALAEASAATAAAEERAAKAEGESLRLRVALDHGITAEDAELFLTGTDEEALTRQAKRLSERDSDHMANGTVVLNEGQITDGALATNADRFAEAVQHALP